MVKALKHFHRPFSHTKNQCMAISQIASSIRFMPIKMPITISMSPAATVSSGTMISVEQQS